MNLLNSLARNNAWANHRLLMACEALKPGEWEAERVSFFPSLKATLEHIYKVDLYYLDALEDGGRGQALFSEDRSFPDTAALRLAQAKADARLIAFCEGLTEADLLRQVATDRGAHGMVAERVDHLLLHLFQHQIHHRGQAHGMLAGTSVAPPQLDEFFLDYDRHPTAEAYR